MSSFEYKQFYLTDIAEIIKEHTEIRSQVWHDDTIYLMDKTIKDINRMVLILNRIDWFLSGEDSEEAFMDRLKIELESFDNV